MQIYSLITSFPPSISKICVVMMMWHWLCLQCRFLHNWPKFLPPPTKIYANSTDWNVPVPKPVPVYDDYYYFRWQIKHTHTGTTLRQNFCLGKLAKRVYRFTVITGIALQNCKFQSAHFLKWHDFGRFSTNNGFSSKNVFDSMPKFIIKQIAFYSKSHSLHHCGTKYGKWILRLIYCRSHIHNNCRTAMCKITRWTDSEKPLEKQIYCLLCSWQLKVINQRSEIIRLVT